MFCQTVHQNITYELESNRRLYRIFFQLDTSVPVSGDSAGVCSLKNSFNSIYREGNPAAAHYHGYTLLT